MRQLATASQAQQLAKYPIGMNIHGYTITNVAPIPEFSLVAVHLRYANGAEHLHLDSENDTNNVFSVAFKTNPPNDTGVPHILEHTTLCGSEKYPVRDPFFKMTNRSLANFMNAMTGHDYTFYPFATTNAKDYENLMDVYLSSVFEPLLSFNDFIQEGWRLENEVVGDKSSPLMLKGVVFNEMKGQNSNLAYYFYIKFLESIYPSLNNSGGDPLVIPSLHYEDLVNFYEQNYHPSRAKTFTYGNIPLINHLRKLSPYQHKGKRAKKMEIKYPISDFNQQAEVSGPVDTMSTKPLDSQYKASITWNLGNALLEENQYKIFKWKILSSLLCDGHSSAFYQSLIEKDLGDDFSANTGFDTTTALLSFSLGLNNITLSQVENLEQTLVDIFQNQVLPEIINQNHIDRVEALLHQIEFNLKKHKPDFGLGLLSGLIPNWVNGVDPIKGLQVDAIIKQFKEDFSTNKMAIFTELIDEDILNNPQRFKFVMKPDDNFTERLAEKEKEITDNMIAKLDERDRDIIYNRGVHLANEQIDKGEQNTEVLPTLTMADIPKKGTFYPLEHSKVNDNDLQTRVVDTNGIAYVNAVKDISYFPTKYYPYLSLFTSCLTNLAGTSSTSITDLETNIQRFTGGISFGSRIVQDPTNVNQVGLQYGLSGKALAENSSHIYQLWHEILHHTKFDANDDVVVDKLSTLIKSMGQNQLNVIADRGHSYASGDSSSRLTVAKYIGDITGGLSQVQFIHELNSNLEKQGKDFLKLEVLPILQDIQQLLINNNSFKYRLVGDKTIAKENGGLIEQFDKQSSAATSTKDELKPLRIAFNQGRLGIDVTKKNLINLPYQVGYSSLSKLGVEYTNKDGAALQILSQLLTVKHLHNVIRELNGAYGGGLNYDGLGGILNFYSYRDPLPLKSVDSFEETCENGHRMLDLSVTDRDMDEAKLRIFQSVDAPMNISSQGSNTFFDGITDDMKQQRREHFLETSMKDVQDVFAKYLKLPKQSVTVIGDNNLMNAPSDWKVRNLNV